MSYIYVSTKNAGVNAKGAVEGLHGLNGTGGTGTFMGQRVSLFNQSATLAAGETWERDSDAAIQSLDGLSNAQIESLEGRKLFGPSQTGSGVIAPGRSFALDRVDAGPASGLVVAETCFSKATVEIALDHKAAAKFGSVTVENIANVNIRVGDGLVQEGCGPCGPTRLDLDRVAKGEFTVNVVNAEDTYVDASSAKFAGGVDVNISLFTDDGRCANTHTAIVAGSVFDDEVVITAGTNKDGTLNTQGENHKVFANLGIGDDSFDSRDGGVLVTRDTVIGGQGDDCIRTGAGKDTIYGDYGCKLACGDLASGDMVDLIGNGGKYLDDQTFFSAEAKIGFVGSEAGYKNILGYYYTDEATGQRVGKLVWDEDAANAEAREGGKVVANIKVDGLTVSEAKSLGFFIVSNGGNLNRGVTDTESNSRSAGAGGRDGLSDLHESGKGGIVVTQGAKGQGQVWLDKNGNGIADAGDVLLVGQTSNGLTGETGITQGSGTIAHGASGAGNVFSGLFTDNALNPNGHDYTKNVGDVGDAFRDAGGGVGNPAAEDGETQWGQVGFEDLYAGKTGKATDRDYDDSVLQVQVTYKVGKSYGDDKLYGGGGDDLIYGDSNCNPCDSKEGGDDIIYGDDGKICVGKGAKDIGDWVDGTGLTIYGRSGGADPLWSVAQGDVADAPHFVITEAENGLNAGVLPFSLGIDADGNDTPRNFGPDSHATPGNPEVNTQADGASDYLGFRLPTAADAAKITLAMFYTPDGWSERNIESVKVKVGNDLNGDGDLDDAGELIGTAHILADGTVLSIDPELAAQGTRLSPGAFDAANPGLFEICLQTALVDVTNCGTEAYSFTDIVLESGGLYQKVGDDYVTVTTGPGDDISDFAVAGLCYVPEQGNDTIFGGGGDDQITAGGDRGHFTLSLKVTFEGVLAKNDNGLGYYYAGADGKPVDAKGTVIDAQVQSALNDGPFSTAAAWDFGNAQAFDLGDPSSNGRPGAATPNVHVIEGIASNKLDKIGFFEIIGTSDRDSAPDVLDTIASGATVDLIDLGAGNGTQVMFGANDLGIARMSNPSLNPTGSSQVILNPDPSEFGQVAVEVPFGSVANALANGGTVGFEDDFVGGEHGGALRDFNDIVVSVDLKITDKNKGDWICGGQGADTFFWNGASVNCVPQGGRADGFDIVKDFNPGQDKLVFDEWSAGSADIVEVDVAGGGHGVLVFDQNYAEGTGVLLLGVSIGQLNASNLVFV